jgi:Uma2 family endonuclease
MSQVKSRRKAVARRPRIGPRSAGRLMTPEQFDALGPERFQPGYRYELINGVLVVTPPAGAGERDPNEELGYLLRTYRENHVQGSTLDATLPEQTVPTAVQRRRADRAIWAGLRRIPDEEKDIPTIVVEFVSSRKRDALRDYEHKRDEYLAAGVKEYWVIDRFQRIMTVYQQAPLGPIHQVVTEAQSYETRLLPGFVLPLARLLAKADDWLRSKRGRRDREKKPNAGGTDG